ncbi:MAG: phage tail protein [Anaerococcus vaginalis]|uniref:phage tail spike protein n=1 Tax=Anaerococcus vaginalis TaxID=33037 RepID=UPI001D84E529|nr:phage tail spike protein [Anaerococcus vaginalis]MBS4889442.1 phage tail protein [Anaerococcus vaginalis]
MLYLFDKNEKLIHELVSSEFESLIQHEELNKLMTLEFGVFIDSNDKMKDIEYVAHKDMEDYQKIQMYRIISSESDDYTVNYQAVHIIFDELKSYGYIRDKRPDKVKASAALNIALAGSRWKVGRVDDNDLLSASFYDSTRLDALSKIIETWNLDLHFYLTFDGNKITGRYIDLLSFRGEDTGERFVYGSNALEVVKEVDVSEVYTRVIPRGKGEEKLDEEGKPTDGYGRRIKIDDVVWEKSKGNPIDKPKGQEYLELKEMTNKFGFSDGEARTRVQIFKDIEDPKELIKAGYDFLVQVSRPLVQFKTKISKRSRTNVGDVVRIIRKDLDFYYRTRIYKAHRNLLNETLEVEFGDKLVQSPADRQKIVSDSLNSLEERIKETETDLKSSFVDKVNEGITHATFNRDGYNYELKKGNKYGLPAGYYSFDREIDDNPQRVIYVGAGTLAIADSKKSNGDWNFRTFGTGKGFVADLLVAGTILGGKVRWNLEDGTFIIGKNADDYSMYWDGGTLHLRNTDIDLSNNVDIDDMKKSISLKVSSGDIISEINQSPEQVKINAGKIDLEGNSINVKGTFQTLNSDDDVGIKIDYNQIHFQDNRRQGYRFGMINVNKLWYKDRAFSLNLGHYQEGFLSVGWYKDDWKEWEPYMVFDRWGKSTYATEGYSIRVLDTINFDKTALFKGNVVINRSTTFNDECKFERNITFGGNRIKIVNYSDGLGFVNGNGEGLFIEGSGAVYLMDTQYKYRVAKE